MRLAQPFIKLASCFDAERLKAEILAINASEWSPHPSGYHGNSSLRLISVNGEENDLVSGGEMRPTRHLSRMPYLRQVLASFDTVVGRSRLMKLAAGTCVPEHVDVNAHWFRRMRVHIPIITDPKVTFTCGDETVHMAAGESWIFDNWLPHSVVNNSENDRIHLVFDTVGSESFWRKSNADGGYIAPFTVTNAELKFREDIRLEREVEESILSAAELELIIADLLFDLHSALNKGDLAASKLRDLMQMFLVEWRGALMGGLGTPETSRYLKSILERLDLRLEVFRGCVKLEYNDLDAVQVIRARIVARAIPEAHLKKQSERKVEINEIKPLLVFDRPIFIVAAPRSGSTYLYEILDCASGLVSFSGEAHGWIEGVESLRPNEENSFSNRLTAANGDDEIGQKLLSWAAQKLGETCGKTVFQDSGVVRLLEKTPKNALRIPFLKALFPDALFVHLWRKPEENISSIAEAWNDGRWITYPDLKGWKGPWSMLLPPGWQSLSGKGVFEVAAFQWKTTNKIILEDLELLDSGDSISINYDELVYSPVETIQKICRFGKIEYDSKLDAAARRRDAWSRYTLTPPTPDKWKKNENEVLSVLDDDIEELMARLQN